MKKIIRILKNPRYLINYIKTNGTFDNLSDKRFLRLKFKVRMGKKLNLHNPLTFNEKLQWLKLYNRNPLYTKLVDKYQVRENIKEKLNSDVLIPILGVWDKPEEINWNSLPNRFVLKCTHNSGGVIVCTDKKDINIVDTEKKLSKLLAQNYYYHGREWPYKNIKPRIIAEKYMEDDSGQLLDYKIMCFNGEPRIIQVMSERNNGNFLINHFDLEWNKVYLPRKTIKENNKPIKRPECLKEMIEISRTLSHGIPFVRIDLYEIEGKVYFGEYTFFPVSGYMDFQNLEHDKKLGKWIDLPINKI